MSSSSSDCGVVPTIDAPCPGGTCGCTNYNSVPGTEVTDPSGNYVPETTAPICLNSTYYYYGNETSGRGRGNVYYEMKFNGVMMIAVNTLPSLNSTIQFLMSWFFYYCCIGNIETPSFSTTAPPFKYKLATNGSCTITNCYFWQLGVYGDANNAATTAEVVAEFYSNPENVENWWLFTAYDPTPSCVANFPPNMPCLGDQPCSSSST
jgi:hypothetical protein